MNCRLKFKNIIYFCFKIHLANTAHKRYTLEWGELGHWCELDRNLLIGQKFSESSPLRLVVK